MCKGLLIKLTNKVCCLNLNPSAEAHQWVSKATACYRLGRLNVDYVVINKTTTEMSNFVLTKIVSGGQTGVDQAALTAAMAMGLEHGGWCPAGRRSEKGRIPAVFQLTETFERNYMVRTEKNVTDSDATIILFREELTGGTLLTERLTLKHDRPVLCVDLSNESFEDSIDRIKFWLERFEVQTLNVAGPRESTSRGIQSQAEAFLRRLFDELASTE